MKGSEKGVSVLKKVMPFGVCIYSLDVEVLGTTGRLVNSIVREKW